MSLPTTATLLPFRSGPDAAAPVNPIVDLNPQAVTVVNQGTKAFTVAGDHHSDYPNGRIRISGSTGNDGTYAVVSAVYGTATVITVVEAIPDATADGDVHADTLQPAIVGGVLDGDAFQLQGKEILAIVNGSGGDLTVTVTSAPDNFGTYHAEDDLVVVVPDGATALLPPLSARKYADDAGLAQVGYSDVTGVLVGLFTFATTS